MKNLSNIPAVQLTGEGILKYLVMELCPPSGNVVVRGGECYHVQSEILDDFAETLRKSGLTVLPDEIRPLGGGDIRIPYSFGRGVDNKEITVRGQSTHYGPARKADVERLLVPYLSRHYPKYAVRLEGPFL